MRSSCLLAIILPAYKSKFLRRTLLSIESQTETNFIVYLCDDASPEPLKEISKKSALYPNQLIYHRFPENMGSQSLVSHWERCISLSKEPWIWLFSDDDLMDPTCVEGFYKALHKTDSKYDLYRFNTKIIDECDQIIGINPPHPEFGSGMNLSISC